MFRGLPNIPSGSPWVFLSIHATALSGSHLLESSPAEEVSGNSSKSKREGQGDQGSIKWLEGALVVLSVPARPGLLSGSSLSSL